MTQLKLYFEFIQYSLGIKEELPTMIADIDWANFYRFAKKQSLLGVVFDGIQRLPQKYAPNSDLLMRWMGNSLSIKRRNAVMYQASSEVFSEIRKTGCRCCILKGQGNAVAYPNQYSRTAGDVDVWVLADRKELRNLAFELASSDGRVEREIVHHIELERKGISIEIHPTPMIFNNPVLNHRMQRWFKRNADLQCSNLVDLPDGIGQIAVPTATFNAIYQLSHLQHHFFYEGVGMRQLVDYYFVLANTDYPVRTDSSLFGDGGPGTDKAALQQELKWLGLWKFAGAVMWVLHEVLGLDESKMIAPMDEKRGKLLLDGILEGGNFGQHSKEKHFGRGTLGHNIQRLRRDMQLIRYYPAEALAEPFFRVWHFLWRISHRTHG